MKVYIFGTRLPFQYNVCLQYNYIGQWKVNIGERVCVYMYTNEIHCPRMQHCPCICTMYMCMCIHDSHTLSEFDFDFVCPIINETHHLM